ncbi:MAG: ribose-5-phosphate isomerase RpiA [Alphaproteobacteria bacterium]|nr:ribose-5-phosphate isomerase RpiA [Alphaproteobacteria bacterium]
MSDVAKQNAAAEALKLVEPGMVLGLGTGSTAAIFVRLLAEKVKAGLDVVGTPTSEATDRLARSLGVRIVDPGELSGIDLTIDGADEFDPQLNLIKGGGAALLREKIIADASARMVVIADAGKEVRQLGRFPLPVEVNPFAAELTRREVLAHLEYVGLGGIEASWRMATGEAMLRTDGGHLILDLKCNAIPDVEALGAVLDRIPGVVEHGLFIGMAERVIVGEEAGARVIVRPGD